MTAEHEAAIYDDTSVGDLGTLSLTHVTTVGQIYLIADDQVRGGRIVADDVTVESADVRGRYDRPHGFGVDALQGGFTIWNRQTDPAVTITARLTDISAVDAPIETFGLGARGFNVYDGSLGSATFESIATYGDGSTGIQVSRSLPNLEVRGDLSTAGGTGESLVKGVLTELAAVALSHPTCSHIVAHSATIDA